MSEGGTHRNGAGHVVPAMVLSWLTLRDSDLRGTTPGAVRNRVAPHSTTRKSTCTRTTQMRGVRQQARLEVIL